MSGPPASERRFGDARKVADAVLYEGYVLYPYRASAIKNRFRWQFGIVAPRGYADSGGSDPALQQTECLLAVPTSAQDASSGQPRIHLRLRFMVVEERRVEERRRRETDDRAGVHFVAVESLTVGDRQVTAWQRGVEREIEIEEVALEELIDSPRRIDLLEEASHETEELRADGETSGRVVRQRWPIHARLELSARRCEPEDGGPLLLDGRPHRVLALRMLVENVTAWPEELGDDREAAMRRSLASVHTLLALDDARFLSLADPPAAVAGLAAACENRHAWPVLLGEPGEARTALSSPIILSDHPEVAPESPGDLCDLTEIDEILTLRIMTLTDEEKAEAAATDERARRIVERSDDIPPEIFERLHGAVRGIRALDPDSSDPGPQSRMRSPASDALGPIPTLHTPRDDDDAPATDPRASRASDSSEPPGVDPDSWDPFERILGRAEPAERATLEIGSVTVGHGSRVRLAPKRRADAMDMFLAGKVAVVDGIYQDVDDRTHVAVTLEDDPGRDLHAEYGRFYYFHPDEIEPLEGEIRRRDSAAARSARPTGEST